MRILHVLNTYLPVSQNWIDPQIKSVPEAEPAILCERRENPDLFPIDSIPLFLEPPQWSASSIPTRLRRTLIRRLGQPPRLVPRRLRRWKPQLIHAHIGMEGWGALRIQRNLGIPLITSFYGVDAWQFPEAVPKWRARYNRLFEQGDRFLVEGPAMRDRLVALGCRSTKIDIVRLGIAVDRLAFIDRSFNPPLRVLMLGRFIPKKGFEDGLNACLVARRQGVDLTVQIIGDAAENDSGGKQIRRDLQTLAAKPELMGRVKFEGFVPPDKAKTLANQANVFLCPSKHAKDGDAEGGSPVALTEAMAIGLFCIGTRHCDIPEVIRNNDTGLLCDSGDVETMAALLEWVVKNPADASSITLRGRKHIENNFSLTGSLQRLQTLYEAVIAAHPGDA